MTEEPIEKESEWEDEPEESLFEDEEGKTEQSTPIGSFAVETEEETDEKEPKLKPLKDCSQKEILMCIAVSLQIIADDNHKWTKFLMRDSKMRQYEKLDSTDLEPTAIIEAVKKMFPSKYLKDMTFQLEDDKVIVAFTKYIGEGFKEIFDIVKKANGTYISAGKNSHFELPRP